MDWTKVNWHPKERTMDILPETPHHKPRWYVYVPWNLLPVAFGILNHLLKWSTTAGDGT